MGSGGWGSAVLVRLSVDVEFIDATLYPGDALYIPPGWWHRVKAATVSFSVSYWWD